MNDSKKYGILLQGRVSSWTKDIISEYKINFPYAEIVFSTWTNEDPSGIDCKVIQSELPKLPSDAVFKNRANINYQIVGTQNGLKNMDSDIVLKTRSDIFIHNKDIFNIFDDNCSNEKIMAPDVGTYNFDYRISDFCLIGKKKLLSEFWNGLELYDGSYSVATETYFIKNYILNIKKDTREWKDILNEYFYIRDYHLDFQIEWEKLSNDELTDSLERLIYAKSTDIE